MPLTRHPTRDETRKKDAENQALCCYAASPSCSAGSGRTPSAPALSGGCGQFFPDLLLVVVFAAPGEIGKL